MTALENGDSGSNTSLFSDSEQHTRAVWFVGDHVKQVAFADVSGNKKRN